MTIDSIYPVGDGTAVLDMSDTALQHLTELCSNFEQIRGARGGFNAFIVDASKPITQVNAALVSPADEGDEISNHMRLFAAATWLRCVSAPDEILFCIDIWMRRARVRNADDVKALVDGTAEVKEHPDATEAMALVYARKDPTAECGVELWQAHRAYDYASDDGAFRWTDGIISWVKQMNPPASGVPWYTAAALIGHEGPQPSPDMLTPAVMADIGVYVRTFDA